MAATSLRGDQIRAGTVPLTALVPGYSIPTANLADGPNFLKKDGSVTMTAALNFGGFKATNMLDGTTATDGATFGQLSAVLSGLATRRVRLVATGNVTTSGLSAVDGVTPVDGDRILAAAQTSQPTGGPWIAHSGAWTRPTDWAAASAQKSTIFWVEEGTTNHDTRWNVIADSITVDTTNVTASQDLSGTSYTGSGVINVSGNVITLNFGQGVENDGSNNLRVKLNGTSLSRGSGGISITPGTAGQIPVTNSGATDVAMVSMSGDATMTSTGAVTVSASNVVKWSNLVTGEVPTGTKNGTNPTFTLANTPKWLFLILNGDVLFEGSGLDFTRSTNTLTMLTTSIPVAADNFFAMYGY